MANHHCSCDLNVDLATHVQQLLFPKSSPLCGWACIGVKNRMARGLGGDYFDFIALPDGQQGILIGDVTGHGMHASLIMALLYGFIHNACLSLDSPVPVVREVNTFLQNFADRSREYDHFFSSTLFWGVINPQTLEMAYVNAGHPPPMICRGQEILTLESCAPPVGFFDDPEIGMAHIQLEPHDRLLLYTDGITETVGQEGELFGEKGLQRLLLREHDAHDDCLKRIFSTLDHFGPGEAMDDATAIVIDINAPLLPEDCGHAS
ncbi:MAG: serine/threonine-protein phosphatase [Desulfuromonas sp.]|nr:MAG: serine/threonine-protein phosphatase [Desulfuromonas sp.]